MPGTAESSKTVKLACTLTQVPSGWKRAGVPLSLCIRSLDLWTSREHSKRWSAINTCDIVKAVWLRVKLKSPMELLDLSKVHMTATPIVLTGHCPVGLSKEAVVGEKMQLVEVTLRNMRWKHLDTFSSTLQLSQV